MTKFQYRGRRSIRLLNYDYTHDGAYFVTICTYERQCLFGNVKDGRMRFSHLGAIAKRCWQEIPEHLAHVHLDEFIVMSNHLHGILWLEQTEPITASKSAFATGNHSKSLSTVISSYKSSVTKQIRKICRSPDIKIWQRNYYEAIAREEKALLNYRKYIQQNPLKWQLDESHPDNIKNFQTLEISLPW